jgi:hypothetical protein
MIDRDRVRELAWESAERRPEYRLEWFLASAEDLAGSLAAIAREIEASPSGRAAPIEMLMAWCEADDKLGFKGADVAAVRLHLTETHRQLLRHKRIVDMRNRVRGSVSDQRADVADRLAYLARVFGRFASLCPGLFGEIPERDRCGEAPTC